MMRCCALSPLSELDLAVHDARVLTREARGQGPQKAKSAYMLFTMAKRAEVVEEFPGIKASEVMKLLGAKWKELSAEDKAVR